jgi:hypothetical protein
MEEEMCGKGGVEGGATERFGERGREGGGGEKERKEK